MHETPLKSIKSLRILLSPLNWGLGHVCRTIPIIQTLLEQQNEVIICCDESQENYYRTYFPELWYVPHEGYPFRFKGKGQWTFDLLGNLSTLNHYLVEEKRSVEEWVEKFNPDLIISDQRFGFYSKRVKSIIISHQLNLPVPVWNFVAKLWNKKLLSTFDEIWIPDNAQQKYSGSLSKGKHKCKKFIGTVSRFSCKKSDVDSRQQYDYLGIVSGPPPYNEQLLRMLIRKLPNAHKNSAIIVPTELYEQHQNETKVKLIVSPCHSEFFRLLNESKVVVSRSGYSTLMDLIETGNESILIPTPGQVEQVYLSRLHKDHPKWRFKTEEEFIKMKL